MENEQGNRKQRKWKGEQDRLKEERGRRKERERRKERLEGKNKGNVKRENGKIKGRRKRRVKVSWEKSLRGPITEKIEREKLKMGRGKGRKERGGVKWE